MKAKILISACLIGENVKYDGGHNVSSDPRIKMWQEAGVLVPVCPEVLGGLSVPRPPCEVVENTRRVMCQTGEDVTEAFERGARECVQKAKEEGIVMAILKARSPSCGKDVIYDGTFSHTKVYDSGVACKLLQENGIMVFSEEELDLAEAFWSSQA